MSIIKVDPNLAPNPVPDIISDRQFFQQLAVMGLITEQEALDAVGPCVLPASMQALIEQLPENDRFAAKMLVSGATTFNRAHPLADMIRALYGLSEAERDQLWRDAAKL